MDATANVQSPPPLPAPALPVAATRLPGRLAGLVLLLRPRQWVKGVLVLLAPLASAPAVAAARAVPLALTLLAFLAAPSAVYIFNDLRDRARDRLHPVKRRRPLASGRVSAGAAIALLCALLAGIGALAVVLPPVVGLVIGLYLVVNLWYCLALKHQPLVDVSIVAAGFVMRVLAGTLAVGLPVEPTLLIAVYCACLALSLGKRRHELAALSAGNGDAAHHRPALKAYSVQFLDYVLVVNLGAALVGYVAFVWLLTPPYGPLPAALTFPFAAFSVYRYLQMVTVERAGGDPVEDLVRDRSFLVNLGLWALVLVPELAMSLT